MGGTEGRAALALPAVLLDSPSNRVLSATHASAGANLHSYLGPALLNTTDTTGFIYYDRRVVWLNPRGRCVPLGRLCRPMTLPREKDLMACALNRHT